MAFTAANLVRTATAPYAAGNPKSAYIYTTDDSVATVSASGYFNSATNTLRKGDLIIAICSISGTPAFNNLVVTSATAAATVTVGASADTSPGLTDNTGGATGAALAANACKAKLTIPMQLKTIADAQVWKAVVPFAFTLVSALFRTGAPATTSSKLTTLTATVNGVAVTGGVVALTSSNQNATGNKVDATAISGAGATGTAGQTIEFTASSTTAFVEGDGYVEVTVLNKDLADALASLNAS